MVRLYAFNILKYYYKRGTLSQNDLSQAYSMLEGKDISLLNNLVYGTLRYTVKIDFYLNHLIKNFKSQPPASKTILRLGVYQLLSNFEDYAAVNETVNLVKNKKTRNFVNAVLRNFIRQKNSFKLPKNVEYSIPFDFFNYIKKNFRHNEEIFISHLMKRKKCIRVNTLLSSNENISEWLKNNEINYSIIEGLNDLFVINSEHIRLENTSLYDKGFFYIQNPSSYLASKILNPINEDTVLDACSAPGGKTSHLSQIMKNKGKIISVDNDIIRLEIVQKNVKRLGIKNVDTVLADVSTVEFDFKFDKILLDATCSATATSPVHPEVLLRANIKDSLNYQSIQRKILSNLFNHIKKNGILVYSTCTYYKMENTENMRWLTSNFDVEFIKFDSLLNSLNIEYEFDGFGYYLIPNDVFSGFYISKMKFGGF
jgi:16S rRNA (cytosine967-C5)-methyltransferase